jgi:hypothetical protein
MLTIRPSAVPSHAAGVYEHELADELLLISDERPEGLTLNPSARAIWQLCDGRRSVRQIAGEIAAAVEMPAERLLDDIQGAVAQLVFARLLDVSAEWLVEKNLDIDWSRMARPQQDLYDAKTALDLLSASEGAVASRPATTGVPVIADGRVTLRHCFGSWIPDYLTDAPLEHPNLAAADAYVRAWPLGFKAFQLLIHTVHPLLYPDRPDDERFFLQASDCHSLERVPGALWSTVNCPVMLAEAFVHEAAHQKLFALGVLKESCVRLIANSPDELYRSPVVTTSKRPMTALVHGVYAYAYVSELDLHLVDADLERDAARRRAMVLRAQENLARLAAGREEMGSHLRTDETGERFFPPFLDWVDDLLRRGARLPIA